MNKDLTLVTAFYDIGRGANYDGRDCNKYLEYFEFLANIKKQFSGIYIKRIRKTDFRNKAKKGIGRANVSKSH